MLAAALLAAAPLLSPRARAAEEPSPAILFLQADRAEDDRARELEAALDAASSSTVHLVLRCGLPRDSRGLDSCLAAFSPRLTVADRDPAPALAAELRAKGARLLVVPADARAAAKKILALSPDASGTPLSPAARAEAEKKAAAVHFDIGDDAGAKAALLRALSAAPDDFDALDLLYRLELRGVWLRDADTYADRAAGLKGLSRAQRATALTRRARTRALLGDDDAAIKDLRESLRLRPNDFEASYRLAQLLRDAPREALGFVELAGKNAPDEDRRAAAARLAAEIRLDLGDAAGARRALAGRADLDSLQLLVRSGAAGERREAAEQADAAAALSPLWERPAAHRFCAGLWRELKDVPRALASLKRALALAPNDVYTLEAMVDLKRENPAARLDFTAPSAGSDSVDPSGKARFVELEALGDLVERERNDRNIPGELRAAARFMDAAREASPWRQPAAYRWITGIWLELGDDNNVQIALGLARDLDRRSLEFEELSRKARRPDARGVIYAANRVAAHVAVAAARGELGDAAGAERDANLALAEDPSALVALRFLARFDLERGRGQEALALADRLAAASAGAAGADRADAERLRAEIELALGDGAAAAKSLGRALALFPDDLESLQRLVEIEEKAGRFVEALAPAVRLTAAVRAAPAQRRAAALVQEARIRLELKDAAGAAKTLADALALEPASPSALRLMTELRLSNGDKKEALEFSGRLVEASAREAPASRAEALRLRSRALLAAGDAAGARRSLDDALALDGSREALSARIQFELAQRRPQEAAAFADRLVAADAAALPARRASDERLKAQVQLELKNEDAAAESLRRALALDSSDREAARLLLNVEKSRGRPREALAAADFLVAASTSADAFRERARLRLELGDEAGARGDFARALALAPEDTASLWALILASPRGSLELVKKHRPAGSARAPWLVLRGMASSFGGDAPAARADFDAAVAADSATVCFGEVSRENRDRFDPLFFDSCLKAFPAEAALYSDRGVARYRAGKTDAAIADFREAVSRAPDLLEARLSLATALAAAGRRGEAAKEAESALARKGARADAVVEQLTALLLPAGALGAGAAPPEFSIAKIAKRFSGYSASIDDVAVSADGKRALTGDFKFNVVLWDAVRGEVVRVMPGHREQVFSIAVSPDGRLGASGSGDGTVKLWDLDAGKLLWTADPKGTQVLSVAFSADGRRVVSGDEAGGIKLWSVADGNLLKEFPRAAAPVLSAAFVDGDRKLLTTDFDNRADLFDLATGKPVAEFHPAGRKPAVKGFVSPDRKRFLLVSDAAEVRDAATAALVKAFPHGAVTGELGTRVAFSPDGSRVLIEGDRQRLSLWDVASGRLERVFLPLQHARAYAFSADGRSLLGVFGGADTILSWPVVPAANAAEAGAKAAPRDPRAADVAALGRLLLFDPRLSRDGRVSCATCHDPKKGWADGKRVAVGIGGAVEARNTMTLLNVAFHHPLFWDGRASDLEEQVHFPLSSPQEMSFPLEEAAKKISAISGYKPYFSKAFGDDAVTPQRISASIAAFERSLVSLDSPYDRYAAGDEKALPEPARRGLEVFRTKGRCFVCHELAPAEHEQFVDIGLPQRADAPDPGRFEVSKAEIDRRAFRVPDLHALKYTAPYMHDGSLETLEKVVDFYDRGGEPDPNKSAWVLPLRLTAGEKADLVAFLESLSGDPLAQEPPANLPK